MYKGFNLNIESTYFSEYVDYGRKLHNDNKKLVKSKLDSFVGQDGELIASKIIAEWFPAIEADIFLSHSHKDEASVLGLSGWLHENFGLTSFIDSCIWGYSNTLLKMIDDQYCWESDRSIYDYNKRNRSTSHVYMMLSTALAKMIDKCEGVFFVNTPNSISADKYIKGSEVTDSPWIYSEIAMTSLVRKRSPLEHRKKIREARDSMESIEKSLRIEYDVDLSHLTQLSIQDLVRWSDENIVKGSSALDSLYKLNGVFYGR